jgi:hypothetical protein
MSFNKEQLDISDEYYVATITDFCNGVRMNVLKEMLVLYEEDENFEACYGVSKALDDLSKIIENGDNKS